MKEPAASDGHMPAETAGVCTVERCLLYVEAEEALSIPFYGFQDNRRKDPLGLTSTEHQPSALALSLPPHPTPAGSLVTVSLSGPNRETWSSAVWRTLDPPEPPRPRFEPDRGS